MLRVKSKTAMLRDFYLYVNIYKSFEKVIDWFSRFMNMMHPCCFLTGINCIFEKIFNRLDDYILCKYHLKRIKMTKISEWLKLNFLEYHIETFYQSEDLFFKTYYLCYSQGYNLLFKSFTLFILYCQLSLFQNISLVTCWELPIVAIYTHDPFNESTQWKVNLQIHG